MRALTAKQVFEPWDPVAALDHLTSIGYVMGDDGYLRLGGVGAPVTFSLLIPSGDLTVLEAAEVIQSEVQTVGIRLVIHAMPLSTMLATTLPEGNYELAIAPFLLTRFAAGEATIYSIPVLPGSAGVTTSTTTADRSEVRLSSASGSTGSAVYAEAPSRGAATSLPVVSNPVLPWSVTTPVGTEPDAALAGVITRDVFGFNDPVVSRDMAEAMTNLNIDQAANDLAAADAAMWQDAPTIPLFQQPVTVIHQSNLLNVAESPTWAGVFWNAELVRSGQSSDPAPRVSRRDCALDGERGRRLTALSVGRVHPLVGSRLRG